MSALSERYAAAFAAVEELIGHRLVLEHARPGGHDRYRVVCDCGYEINWGKSFRYAVSAGVGHLGRVADRLEPDKREAVGVSLSRVLISGAA